MAVLAFPLTYLAHRGLARFVLSSSNPEADFTDVVEEHFGVSAGRLISLLYFLSIFPILLIYGVGITNTVSSFLVNQLGMAEPSRIILSGLLIFPMVAIMMAGEKIMLKVFALMVYPLVAILAVLSLYLVQEWKVPALTLPAFSDFTITTWLALPVLIFSFSHAAAVSSFANVQRRHYGDKAIEKSESILNRTAIMLVAFVLLFVFSCVLALSPAQLADAKAANVSVLSYLANVTNNPFIATLGPLVAFIAITSSFLGHFMGARESLNGLITKHSSLSLKNADHLGVIVMFFAIWFAAVMNRASSA